MAWQQALFFEVAFYWAVPIFFMLTGATLFDYRNRYSTKQFFIKRLQRAVFPFLLCSLSLLGYGFYTGAIETLSIKESINMIFNTRDIPFIEIYWFFIHLFSLYMLVPVLSLLKDNYSILCYIVGAMFLTHSFFPVIFDFLKLHYNWSIIFPMAGYSIYLVLGYLLSRYTLENKYKVIIYILGVFGAIFRYVYTYHSSLETGHLDRTLFSYMQFHTVFLAVAIFVFVKDFFSDIKFFNAKVLAVLSSCSLGIYLIHKLIMHYELKLLAISEDNFYWRFFGAFMTYNICLVIVLLVKRVPYLRAIFP
ncbi:acyltransferase [Actinobacillus arthritidis]|uniref:acyltransferase n=1 Tax=Actinobacillus arthritidis TaxID=157339 RepID=UPI0024415FA2|nr:acyltransferase family protein [Actinobacillus arthritidis]WGE89336.1 acyltransferase family protein [Actinobacillus arthritidis]